MMSAGTTCDACRLGLGWAVEYLDEHGDPWISEHRTYEEAMGFAASIADGSLVAIHIPEVVLA